MRLFIKSCVCFFVMPLVLACSSQSYKNQRYPARDKVQKDVVKTPERIGRAVISNVVSKKNKEDGSKADVSFDYEISDFQAIEDFYACYLTQIITPETENGYLPLFNLTATIRVECNIATATGHVDVLWKPLQEVKKNDGSLSKVGLPYRYAISISHKSKDGKRFLTIGASETVETSNDI